MRRVLSPSLAVVVCLFSVSPTAAFAQSAESIETAADRSMPGAVHPGPAAPSRAIGIPVTSLTAASHRIDLGLPAPSEKMTPEPASNPMRIGFERPVPAGVGVVSTDDRVWRSLPDGSRMTTLAVTSTGAVGLRLALKITAAPDDTLFLVHRSGVADSSVEPLRAADAFVESPSRRTGARTARPRLLWSGIVDGDTALLDVVIPPGTSPSAIEMHVSRVAHLDYSPIPGSSLSCNRDIACDKSWSRVADAVAHYAYQQGKYTYICSGTLLNSTSGDPLFATAAHCVRNRSQASGMTFYWLYERTKCSSEQYNYQATVGGAQLLKTTGQPTRKRVTPDTTLLRLNNSPPAGTVLSGWSADLYDRDPVRGIHHPMGDVKKISTGATQGVAVLGSSGPATHYIVEWTRGVTEGGSSGSGIFAGTKWPDQYLIGVLTGGPEPSCTPHIGLDFYGRLDLVYPKLQRWLQ